MPPEVRLKDFPFPVKRMVLRDKRIYVLAAPPPGMGSCKNLFALERSGRIMWRVGPPAEDETPEPFVELRLAAGGKLLAQAAGGRRFVVDCRNGDMTQQDG